MESFGKAQEASLRTNKLSPSPGAVWVGNVGKSSGWWRSAQCHGRAGSSTILPFMQRLTWPSYLGGRENNENMAKIPAALQIHDL